MIRDRTFAPLVLGALLAGCAGGSQPAGVAPANVPALEAERNRRPTDPNVLTQLGAAYYDAKDYAKARDVLRSAVALDPKNVRASVLLGLSFEGLGQLDSAGTAYTAARAAAPQRERADIDTHLLALGRKQLAVDARAAIANEKTLSTTPPEPNTVAVLPWRYLGADSTLRPLERGVAYLITTDLGKIGALRLLERERVQALADEMALAQSGRVEAGSAARSGRLLRANRVVQGSLLDAAGNKLRLDASVVNATDASVAATGTASDRLQQLLDMEKVVVLDLVKRLGITLTPAEQRAISERPTADLQAFLAFSRGLGREDVGDFAGATQEFNAAIARDPSFRAAQQHRATTVRLTSAQFSPNQFATVVSRDGAVATGDLGGALRRAIDIVTPSLGGRLGNRFTTVPPILRSALPEALQADDPRGGGFLGQIIIIIDRP